MRIILISLAILQKVIMILYNKNFISYNVANPLNLNFISKRKCYSFFLSFLLISSFILLFSLANHPITDSHARSFCKAVKYKDDGKNDYNIYIGTSQFGIGDCIIGTDKKDVIIGGDGPDIIKGKGDNDNLQGRFDNDQIRGNDGDDNIQGGSGGDYLYGNDDNDIIFAGFDDDFLSGGDGNDELYGDFGNDILEGGRGADYFDCGENYDIVLDYNPGDGDILANNCEEIIRI
jgi:RTX calcium-binding nonapeptide repeat (4 copies)